MSNQKQIIRKISITNNSSIDKNIPIETENTGKNGSSINLSKVSEKELSKPSQNDSPQENKEDPSSKQIADASIKNIVENVSDLQNSCQSELQKSISHDKNNKNTSQNQKQNRLQISVLSDFSELNCQDIEIKGYFSQFSDIQSNQTHKINKHQKNIFANIKNELSKGNLLIESTRPFPLKKKEQKPTVEQEKQMKQKLEQKRQQALMKIKQIQMQEIQLKRRAVSTLEKSRKDYTLSKISQSVDKQEIKKALQEYKKFTKEMKQKEEQVQKERENQHMLELQKQQELMQIRKQSRRQEVKNHLKEISQRQKIRKSIIEEWKAKQKDIKNKKYLYIEYKQKEKKEEQIKEMQHQQVIDRIRKNHQFDKDDIEKHRRKYEELLQERREMSKSLSSSSVTNAQMKRYEMSKFHQQVLKEMEDQKKKQLEKLMKVKEGEYKQKIQKYQQKIDNQIKPNLHYKKFVPLPRSISLDVLPPQQHRQLGLKYLEKAKKLKMPENELKILNSKREEQDKLKISRSTKQTKDYLQEMKKNSKYESTENKLGDMLKNKHSSSNYETLKDAKYMSDYLVEKSKHSQQKKTMLAIKKKMDILNSIY